MPSVDLAHYPFDFHTHFWGVLPVRPTVGYSLAEPCIEHSVFDFYQTSRQLINGHTFTALDVKRRMFALCIMQARDNLDSWVTVENGYIRNTTETAVAFGEYMRGECLLENAIIARNLILNYQGVRNTLPETDIAALEAALIAVERSTLNQTIADMGPNRASARARFSQQLQELVTDNILTQASKQAIEALSNDDTTRLSDLAACCVELIPNHFYKFKFLSAPSAVYRYYDYFNDQFYTCNVFTPFDDGYVARDALKDLAPIHYAGQDYTLQDFMIDDTLDYYAQNNITHTQLSMGKPSATSPLFEKFNAQTWPASHKILYHNVNHNVGGDNGKLYKFIDTAVTDFINQDNTDHNFKDRVIGIDFLGSEQYIDFENLFHVLSSFSAQLNNLPPAVTNIKRKFTLRVHCGEGSGITAENRSILGYQIVNSSIHSVFENGSPYDLFLKRLDGFKNGSPVNGEIYLWPNVTNLFAKVFSGDYTDQRFNIFSEKTKDRITAIAETNMMALYHAATKLDANGNYVYGTNSVFENIAFRLGHGHHARQYIHGLSQIEGLGQGLKKISFDSNLGSNFITGSSTEFHSFDDYERAAGIRTLTSYAPEKYVQNAINAVFGTSALSDALYGTDAFPLLIGSDGQGVEHTILARENARAFILSVLRAALGKQYLIEKDLLSPANLDLLNFSTNAAGQVSFITDYAIKYWEDAIEDVALVNVPPVKVKGSAWVNEQRVEPIDAGQGGFSYTKSPEFDIRWD